ncbi:MAG: exo-alpha-sialidase [Chloroflexi bacterium]|nr:exo-alpha-sialidase [Chloroflexota bacterium]
MTQVINLPGLRLKLHKPRVAAEGVGFCWYPDILKFASGELMLAHSLNADANGSQITAQSIRLSFDQGQTWEHAYDVNGFHCGGGEVRISLADGSLAGPSYAGFKPDPPGQWRSLATHYWRFDQGGRRYSVETWGARIEGLPRDVAAPAGESRWNWVSFSLFGTAVAVAPGRYVTTGCLRYQGDTRETTVALVSEDEGRTWRYLSTIAGPDDIPDAKEGFDEPCMVKLADGDLMCVSRVGGGSDQPLARAYSSDGGQSWTGIDRLPAWSVAPNMARLENGVIALSTGRPGLFLWLSADARGKHWEPFDLIAYHNSVLEQPHHMSLGASGLAVTPREKYINDHFDFNDPWQTTAYTAMLEVSPNRLFLVYDRMPYGWMPVPTDAEVRGRILAHYPELALAPNSLMPRERARIYLLEVEVERE